MQDAETTIEDPRWPSTGSGERAYPRTEAKGRTRQVMPSAACCIPGVHRPGRSSGPWGAGSRRLPCVREAATTLILAGQDEMDLYVVERSVARQFVAIDRQGQVADKRVCRLRDVHGTAIERPSSRHTLTNRHVVV